MRSQRPPHAACGRGWRSPADAPCVSAGRRSTPMAHLARAPPPCSSRERAGRGSEASCGSRRTSSTPCSSWPSGGDRPGGARHRRPGGGRGARRGRTGTVAAARHPERPNGARSAGPRGGPCPLRRARRHRQRAADPRRCRPRPRRGLLGRPTGGRLRLARAGRCRRAAGGRLRCAGRGGEPVARHLRRRSSALPGRRPRRLACRPGAHGPRGASRLHARAGSGHRCRR